MQLRFEPLISPALWAALALLAAVMLAWYGWRRPLSVRRGRWALVVVLMATGVVLPLVILLNPTWQIDVPPPAGKPLLTILVDVSASMSATDMPAGESRHQAAAAIAKACARELSDKFEIRAADFSSHLVAADTATLDKDAAQGESTDLAAAIGEALAGGQTRGRGLLVLSDGIHNAGGGTSTVLSALSAARAAAVPIYTKTLGGAAEIDDLALRSRSPQQLAFIGQSVPLSVTVRRLGRAPRKVTLTLTDDGKEVGRQQVTTSAEGQADARFLVRQEAAGVFRYEVGVEPFEGEITQVNNFVSFLLRVVDEPIRVLLVEGKPYWDGKFLIRTLLSDPSIELVSVVRLAEGRLVERTIRHQRPAEGGQDRTKGNETTKPKPAGEPVAAPLVESWKIVTQAASVLADAKALRSYQVIVLGRDAEVFLSDDALENLRQWLSRDSGSLVCYRGQPTNRVSQRLGRFLPVQWSPAPETHARVQLTDSGRDLRWFEAIGGEASGDLLPRLQSLAIGRAEKPKPLATVLAAAVGSSQEEELPVISFQPYGGGRVVVVEGAGMWRWAFLPPAYAEHHDLYAALWQSLLRWLVSGAGLLPGEQLALKADKVTFRTDEQASATLLVRDEVDLKRVTVELTADDGRVSTFEPAPSGDEPGTFRLAFGELPEGRYRARAGGTEQRSGAETAFDVRRFSEEQLDLNARPDLMARIAQSTGGAVLEGNNLGEIARHFAARLSSSQGQEVRRLSAWDRWWVLMGAFGLWGVTWMLRRQGGLV
jgi:hypothetical protein